MNLLEIALFIDRTLPGTGSASGGTGGSLNTILIVGLALLISYLGILFSRRGKRK